MKSLIYLVLLATASALPSAVVLPSAEIDARAAVWMRANPSAIYLVMTSRPDCGSGASMRPMLQPKDRLFYEAYVGQKLKGQVALVNVAWCKIPISHLVYDETATHVFLTGIANRKSDGWVPKSQVCGVLVGVLRPE